MKVAFLSIIEKIEKYSKSKVLAYLIFFVCSFYAFKFKDVSALFKGVEISAGLVVFKTGAVATVDSFKSWVSKAAS